MSKEALNSGGTKSFWGIWENGNISDIPSYWNLYTHSLYGSCMLAVKTLSFNSSCFYPVTAGST